MNLTSRVTLVVAFSLLAIGCSSNWKEGSFAIDEDTLFSELDQMAGISSRDYNGGGSLFSQLRSGQETNIYYAKAPDDLPPQSLLSFSDFSIFDSGHAELSPFDIESGAVAFLDGFDNEVRRFALKINYQLADSGQPVSVAFADDGYTFGKDVFEVVFPLDEGQLIVRTYDLKDGVEDFTAWIQLRFYHLTSSGEVYIGKVSALNGYGTE